MIVALKPTNEIKIHWMVPTINQQGTGSDRNIQSKIIKLDPADRLLRPTESAAQSDPDSILCVKIRG